MSASFEVQVVLPAALHARPAGAVVRTAAGFASTVEVVYRDRPASAKGVLALLGLGATAGETVLVRAVGDDATEAAAAVAAILRAAA